MMQRAEPPPARRARRAAAPPSPYPPALLDFMARGWQRPAARRTAKVAGLAQHRARRAALSARFPGDVIVVPSGGERVRANDTHFRFRPGSHFVYLTGNLEPDAALVLMPKVGGGHTSILFVDPDVGRADPSFFTDRERGSLWVGPTLGVEGNQRRHGVDEARPRAELLPLLRGLGRRPRRVVRGLQAAVDRACAGRAAADGALVAWLAERRLCKDAFEVRALQAACAATRRGFEDVIASLPTSRGEREVEGVFNLRARLEGYDVGYNSIAAAGAHACVLHWTRNDGPVRPGDLLLLDAGIEGEHLYTADITRTLPISGRFSAAQRTIYDLVLAAQTAAIAEVRPGRDFLAPHRKAMQVLAEGLCALKILPMPAALALDPAHQYHRRYTLHGTSHMLGLDVHDCAEAPEAAYRKGQLQPGMVLTVEPGLYFQPDDATVPARFRGIGVRIEDDLVVTARGHRILSDVPRTADDVEAWMRAVWRRPRPQA